MQTNAVRQVKRKTRKQRQALIRAGGARDRNGEARAAARGRAKQIGSQSEYVAFGRVRSGKATGMSVEAT
jgi:hypothetical protein